MRIIIVIVYPHRRDGGAICITGGFRTLNMKSAEEGGSSAIAGIIFGRLNWSWGKRSNRRNYENIISKKWRIILWHYVRLTWNYVDLRRNILDGRKTYENNQNGLGLSQWNFQKIILVPCLIKYNFWQDGFSGMIKIVIKYGNTWSGD